LSMPAHVQDRQRTRHPARMRVLQSCLRVSHVQASGSGDGGNGSRSLQNTSAFHGLSPPFGPESYSSRPASGEEVFHAALRAAPTCFVQLLPAHRGAAGGNFRHRNAAGNRTHQSTKIAADTFVFQDVRNALGDFTMAKIASGTLLDAN